MRTFGTVSEIWRYPVSSLGGERLSEAMVSFTGVVGDRQFALVDLVTGEVASPENMPRWRKALMLRSSSQAEGPRISFPDGEIDGLSSECDEALTDFLGFSAGIRPFGSTLEFDDGRHVILRSRYAVSPLHILTTASLLALSQALPGSVIDSRRFRPTFVIDAGEMEPGWIGGEVVAGGIAARISEATKRCGFTLAAQPGLPEDPDILRTLVRSHKRSFGVYGNVITEGILSLGDVASVL